MTKAGNRRINFMIMAAILVAAMLIAPLARRFSLQLLLVAILAIGGILLLLRAPDLGPSLLVAVAFLVPLELNVSNTVKINAVVLFLPILLVFWVMIRMQGSGYPLRGSRTFLPLAAFVAVAGLAWLSGNIFWDARYSQPPNLILVQIGQLSIFVLSAVAFYFMAQQPMRALRWAVYVFIALGAVALLGRYGGELANTVLYSPISKRAVTNGSFFVWLTALAGGAAMFDNQLPRPVRGLLLILMLGVPLFGLTQDQEWTSSWLPSIVVVGMLFWIWVERRSRALALLMLVPLPAIILTFWQAYALNEENVSVVGRTILWESIISLALQNPILGLGLTTYRHYHQFIPLPTGQGGIWFSPNVNSHNMFVDIFAQMGVVGLIVFIWFLSQVALIGWRNRTRFSGFRNGYVAAMIAGLVGSLFASALVDWFLPFVYNAGFPGLRFSVLGWMFLGGLVIVAQQAKASAGSEDSTPVKNESPGNELQKSYSSL